MDFVSLIGEILKDEKIEYFSAVPLEACKIGREYLLTKNDFTEDCVAIVFAVPYFLPTGDGCNVSVYAVPRDYHLYFSELFERIIPRICEKFPKNKFVGFSDHSPIDEVHAAALGGLGVIGKNRLLITEKYSSFVFLGEIITDLHIETELHEIRGCENCGRCAESCPFSISGECLSELNQKKGMLTEGETAIIKESRIAWGCDVCQNVCPHTEKAVRSGTIITPIDYFRENRIEKLTSDDVQNMTDEEFSRRAYSWRKRETILRNLSITENQN